MSFRLSPILLLAAALACRSSDGPQQRDDAMFTYTSTVPDGQAVYVKNLRGSIEVTPSPDDSLRVVGGLTWRGSSGRPRDIQFSGTVEREGILICVLFGNGSCTVGEYSFKKRFGRRSRASDVKAEFRVQVPAGVRLELVGVDTRIVSASSGPVQAKTMNGDVLVATAVGPVEAVTMNGNVDARMTTLAGSDSVIVKTMNGNAWAFIPESATATVDVATTNGRVRTDFGEVAAGGKKFTGLLGGGGTPVYVRTMNGTAGLGRLDAEGKSSLQP